MKKVFDLSLYLVTHRESMSLSAFKAIITQAVRGGVTMVQLREKEQPSTELTKLAKQVHAWLKAHNVPLIINDCVETAIMTQAEGVHIGQSDACAITARNQLGPDAIIGLSVETFEQAHAAFSLPIDYIAASPVFVSKTKPDANRPWGLSNLSRLCELSPLPVVGIGGVHPHTLTPMLDTGLNGVAVVSSIFSAPNPEQAAHEMMDSISAHRSNQTGLRR